jgi:hypothetical protein
MIGGTCSMHIRKKEIVQNFGWNTKESSHLGNLDARIILIGL